MLRRIENSIRKVFGLAARPPEPEVPKEIVNNKYVRKAVNKSQRGRLLKRLFKIYAASAALSVGLQYAPDMVSQPLDNFMASKGYDNNYSQHFHTPEIRVYDRYNPLYPFHRAGRTVGMVWHENLKSNHLLAIPLAMGTPILYTQELWTGFTDMLPGSKLDAWSIAPNDPLPERTNFIRPPGDFSLEGFMRDFSGQNGKKLVFNNDRDELRSVLFEFVMLHEARHGDQQKLAIETANESDADLYAFKVLLARGVKPALAQEAATIVAHARSIQGAVGGDPGHVTTFTLARGGQRIFDAHQDAASFQRLHDLLKEADGMNDKAFAPGTPIGNRYFYLTLAMHGAGLLNEDPGLKKAAGAFLASIDYFDAMAGGKIIDQNYDLEKIDLRYLTQQYKPVPDKLRVQPPKPLPPAARPPNS